MQAITFTGGNGKLGHVSQDGTLTMYSWARPYGKTCPLDCPFLTNATNSKLGCYAAPDADDKARFRINQMAKGADKRYGLIPPIERLESGDIARLHTVGDVWNAETNKPDLPYIKGLIAKSRDYIATHNVKPPVFTFTHAWKNRVVSKLRAYFAVIASCDTLEDVKTAKQRGWFVSWHSADIDLSQAYTQTPSGPLLNCPNQRFGTKCVDCRVCWSLVNRLESGDNVRVIGVGFLEHK